jgi:hypothetical protein
MVRQQSEQLRLRVGEKDSRRIALSLRDYGVVSGKDLSGYDSILFEWENPQGIAQTPLALSEETVGADWAQGVVVLEFTSSDVTAAVGDYRFGITLFSASETRTILTGVVEVFDRAADSFSLLG